MTHRLKWLQRSTLVGPYMALCLTPATFAKACKHLKVPACDFVSPGKDATVHFYSQKGNTVALVCLNPGKDVSANIGLLVHEAVHVWQQLCEDMGEGKPGDEVEAYAIQAISERLIGEYLRAI